MWHKMRKINKMEVQNECVDYFGICYFCEVSATTSLKYAAIGGNKLFLCVFALLMGASFALVFQAIKTIDLSTAYAVWSGVGLVLVGVVGFVVFREEVSAVKLACMALIIIGVVGLKILSKA